MRLKAFHFWNDPPVNVVSEFLPWFFSVRPQHLGSLIPRPLQQQHDVCPAISAFLSHSILTNRSYLPWDKHNVLKVQLGHFSKYHQHCCCNIFSPEKKTLPNGQCSKLASVYIFEKWKSFQTSGRMFMAKQTWREKRKALTDYGWEWSPWASVWNTLFEPFSIAVQCEGIRKHFIGSGWSHGTGWQHRTCGWVAVLLHQRIPWGSPHGTWYLSRLGNPYFSRANRACFWGLCGNSATVLPGSCGRTLIIREDLKGTQSWKPLVFSFLVTWTFGQWCSSIPNLPCFKREDTPGDGGARL